MSNSYETRKQLRTLQRQKYSKEKKEINTIGRNAIEKKYQEAFKLVFGFLPKVIKPLSTKSLQKRTDELFAEAHAREICLSEEIEN